MREALRANETSLVLHRKSGGIVRVHSGVVGSNAPCEDKHAIDVIPKTDLSLLLSETGDDQGAEDPFWAKLAKVKNMIIKRTKPNEVPARVSWIGRG